MLIIRFYVSARVFVHTGTESRYRKIHTAEQIAFGDQFTFLNTSIIQKFEITKCFKQLENI